MKRTKVKNDVLTYWLSPAHYQDSGTTPIPPPEWEGVLNFEPRYMDLAFYNMHKIRKDKIKSYMQVHKTMSAEEILSGMFYYDVNKHIICVPKAECDYIILASKDLIGYVMALAKGDVISKQISSSASEDKRWTLAVIVFESNTEEEQYKAYNSSIKEKDRMLTLYDENFILAKSCKLIEPEEVKDYIMCEEIQFQEQEMAI